MMSVNVVYGGERYQISDDQLSAVGIVNMIQERLADPRNQWLTLPTYNGSVSLLLNDSIPVAVEDSPPGEVYAY